MIASSNQLGV